MRLAAAALAAPLAAIVAILSPIGALADGVTVSHAIAEFGEPKYGPDFKHFDYANPDAPKGGTVTIGAGGSFDSLMVQAQDDLSLYYPLVAESVEYPADRSWAIFNLRADARFHDGTPLTGQDVAWSFDAIKEHGDPFLKAEFDDVTAAENLETNQATTRAVDRVLLHSHYLVPHLTNSTAWVTYWDRFGFPDIIPTYNFAHSASIGFQPTWWIDPEKDALLADAN